MAHYIWQALQYDHIATKKGTTIVWRCIFSIAIGDWTLWKGWINVVATLLYLWRALYVVEKLIVELILIFSSVSFAELQMLKHHYRTHHMHNYLFTIS